jgi:hypothetical protein
VSLNRYAKRRDTNEGELVAVAKQFGALWIQDGPLDGWVGYRGHWTPVEIKHGKNRYTDAQHLFIAKCLSNRVPYFTWRTERDVFESLGAQQTA